MFNETCLPPQEKFCKKSFISDEDYLHPQNFWNTMNIKNLDEYTELYLKTDVLLLADIFEDFGKKFLNNFGLDPAHYVSSLSLSWDAMLKMTKVELDHIYNNEMHTFIESGLRGRILYIANRYAKANNPHMESYDPDKKTSYNIYLDENNLYGWAMSQPLPYADFRWKFKFSRKELKRVINDPERGALLEVDLEYPKELHDSHNDYPLAPEKIIVKPEMLYKYCQDLKNKYDLPNGKVLSIIKI